MFMKFTLEFLQFTDIAQLSFYLFSMKVRLVVG